LRTSRLLVDGSEELFLILEGVCSSPTFEMDKIFVSDSILIMVERENKNSIETFENFYKIFQEIPIFQVPILSPIFEAPILEYYIMPLILLSNRNLV
jgi:hypothetical protein